MRELLRVGLSWGSLGHSDPGEGLEEDRDEAGVDSGLGDALRGSALSKRD